MGALAQRLGDAKGGPRRVEGDAMGHQSLAAELALRELDH
jgi:hypothetical protein